MAKIEGKTILVVDDEKMVRETLSEYFAIKGAMVLQASNGQVAFDILNEQEVDLVISDIRMPECSGIELLEKIKASDKKMPPIIIMSAFQDLTPKGARLLGAKHFVAKTEDFDKIASIAENLLRS